MKRSFWRGVLIVLMIPALIFYAGMGFAKSFGFDPESNTVSFLPACSITAAFFLVTFLLEHFYQKGVRAGAEKERQEILCRQMHGS